MGSRKVDPNAWQMAGPELGRLFAYMLGAAGTPCTLDCLMHSLSLIERDQEAAVANCRESGTALWLLRY